MIFQGWIISHFPRLSVWSLDKNYNETLPRCAKYVPGQGHKDAASYREHLDNMQMSDFVYTPYDAHRGQRPLIDVCWFSGWLRSGSYRGTHLPERVLRQYGYVQGIPRPPAASAPAGMSLAQIDHVYMEEMEDRLIDEAMRGARVVKAWDYEPGYIAWFYKVSHPQMLRVEAHAEPPRPPMLEVLIERQSQNDVRDTVEICRQVRAELRRALRDGEAVPGTPIYGTIERVIEMISPTAVYASRRRHP